MKQQIDKLKNVLEPFRQEIINHKVYEAITDIDDLKIFMQHHVYAVWDFMSLLKTLQNNLTCTTVPWFPKGSPTTRQLINEIVLGEESDVDMDGNVKSHYEIYIEAMQQCKADTSGIINFTSSLQNGESVETAVSQTDSGVQSFVKYTFNIINSNKDYLQSAVFTFGREDLIPGMFFSLVKDLYKKFPESVSIFKYYLERHIEVDGDHHSNLALQMTENLCGNDSNKWKEAEEASIESLKQRISLWDGVYKEIMMKRELKASML